MCSSGLVRLLLLFGSVVPRAAAEEAALQVPSDLADRTRGAWIEIYRSWLELPNGNALPVHPGPAFCVGSDGFAVVDQNAVAGTVHLFATILGHGPYAARARAFDAEAGIAAVQLNPGVLAGVACLRRAPEDAPPLRAGDVLYAIGPAAAQPVPLRVQTVSAESIGLQNARPDTFLAGTPLVDGSGALRGMLVGGQHGGRIGKATATGALAGLAGRRHASGAIPVSAAFTLIDQIQKQQAEGMPSPPAEPVVRASGNVYPRPLRRAVRIVPDDLPLYAATRGDVTVEFLTPPSVEARLAFAAYSYARGKSFFRWTAHTQMWEPMVAVQQAPAFEWTAGSHATAVLAVIFAIPIVLGRGDPTFVASYTFPRSNASMAIVREGVRIPPHDAFVDCFEDTMPIEKEPGHDVSRRVRGCRTFYLFPSSALSPGAEVAIRLTAPSAGTDVDIPVRPETQARIAADFAPWDGAQREGPATGPSGVIDPPPIGVPYVTTDLGIPVLRITKPAGAEFFASLEPRGGEPLIRIPVVYKWSVASSVSGALLVSRDAVSFEPWAGPRLEKYAFTLARADVKATKTSRQQLRIDAGGKHWRFDPICAGSLPSLSEAFGSVPAECRAAALDATLALLGDFDRAVGAFARPETLVPTPVPGAGASTPR